jgi:hypothetical protein
MLTRMVRQLSGRVQEEEGEYELSDDGPATDNS